MAASRGGSATTLARTPTRRATLVFRGVFAAAFSCISATTAAATVNVHVVSGDGTPLPTVLTISADPVARAEVTGPGSGRTLPLRSASPSLETQGRMLLDPGVWAFRVAAAGSWSERRTVSVGGSPAVLHLRLFRSGSIQGRLALPPNVAPPQTIQARFEALASRRSGGARLSASAVCPVKQSRFVCELPAIAMDLALYVPWSPGHHLWGIDVPSGPARDVGTVAFRPTASVEGRVFLPSGNVAPRDCRVSLRTLDGNLVLADSTARQGARRPVRATVNARGFYQFVDAAPGSYRVVAEHPAWARAEAIIHVVRNAQTVASPLVLKPPETLVAQLSPAVDPMGEPWLVQLTHRQPGLGVASPPSLAATTGRWELQQVSPGPYWIDVSSADGSSWASQEVDIPAPGVVDVSLEPLRVTGIVRLGTSPLRGRVVFGGSTGAVRVSLDSDDEGKFDGVIPEKPWSRDGTWLIFVEADEPPVNRYLTGVRPIEESPGHATLDLTIPTTTLTGTIRDEQGRPPARAIVTAQTVDQPTHVTPLYSDSEGRFRCDGLPEGLTVLVANSPDRATSVTRVRLKEGKASHVDLTAVPNVRIRGRVVTDQDEPVPGAVVRAYPVQQAGLWPPSTARSDVDGEFELSVAGGSDRIAVSVGAVGFALRTLVAPARSGTPLVLRIARHGGSLSLRYRTADARPDSTRLAFLSHHGWSGLVPELLAEWARINAESGGEVSSSEDDGTVSVVVPQMEAGPYSLCRLSLADRLGSAGDDPPSERCILGYLAPGGMMALDATKIRD